jgi:hypothetical protein
LLCIVFVLIHMIGVKTKWQCSGLAWNRDAVTSVDDMWQLPMSLGPELAHVLNWSTTATPSNTPPLYTTPRKIHIAMSERLVSSSGGMGTRIDYLNHRLAVLLSNDVCHPLNEWSLTCTYSTHTNKLVWPSGILLNAILSDFPGGVNETLCIVCAPYQGIWNSEVAPNASPIARPRCDQTMHTHHVIYLSRHLHTRFFDVEITEQLNAAKLASTRPTTVLSLRSYPCLCLAVKLIVVQKAFLASNDVRRSMNRETCLLPLTHQIQRSLARKHIHTI